MNISVLTDLCLQDPFILEEVKEDVYHALKVVKKINKKPAWDLDQVDKLCKLCVDIYIDWMQLENYWKQTHPNFEETVSDQPETLENSLVRQLYLFAKENTHWRQNEMTLEGSPSLIQFYLTKIKKILDKAVQSANKGVVPDPEELTDSD